MARFSSAWRTAGAGSTTLPIAGLTATATCRLMIREIGVFNTTGTAVVLALRRMSALGTPGSTVATVPEDDNSQTAVGVPKDTWTVTGTFGTGSIRVASLGAAVGSGIIWTFSDSGVVIPNTTTDAIVVVPYTGTGQICDVSLTWDE